MREALSAPAGLDEARRAGFAPEVNHDAQRIPHDDQIRKDASRTEKGVSVPRNYLDLAEASYRRLQLPIEIYELRRPILENGCGAGDSAGVTLIRRAKAPITPRTVPTHNGNTEVETGA
jgi:hypothetical protein